MAIKKEYIYIGIGIAVITVIVLLNHGSSAAQLAGTNPGAFGTPGGVDVNPDQSLQVGASTPETNEELTILSASYGPVNSAKLPGLAAPGTKDVTSVVQSKITDNSLILNPTGAAGVLNAMFGDPAPNYPKQLTIQASLGGLKGQYGPFAENDIIKINAQ